MRFHQQFRLLVLLSTLTAGSCTNSLSSATSPGFGTLTGYVYTFPIGSSALSSAGAAVQVDGVGKPVFTDSTGFWRVDGVTLGVHFVTFFKLGFGAMKVFNVLVPGPGVQYMSEQYLAENPNAEMVIDSLKNDSLYFYVLAHAKDRFSTGRNVVLYVCLSRDSALRSIPIIRQTFGALSDVTGNGRLSANVQERLLS